MNATRCPPRWPICGDPRYNGVAPVAEAISGPLVTPQGAGLGMLGTVAGVRLRAAAGLNGAGIGLLTYSAQALLSWRAPRSRTPGAGQDVSAGGEFVLVDGSDADKWLAATVYPAYLAGGSQQAKVELTEPWNNALAGPDVPYADAVTGMYGEDAFYLLGLKDAAVTARFWLDIYTAQLFAITAGGDPEIWSAPVTEAAALEIVIPAGELGAFKLRRVIPAHCPPGPRRRVRLRWTATSGGTTQRGELTGLFRIFGPAGYRLYDRADAPARPGIDLPIATFASLPGAPEIELADGAHYLTLGYSNGLYESHSGPATLFILAGGLRQEPPPRPPQNVTLTPRVGGAMRVSALYSGEFDGARRATHWALWLSRSGAPTGAGAPDLTVPANFARGYSLLQYDIPAALGDVQYVLVKMLRADAAPAYSAGAAASAAVVSAGPGMPGTSGAGPQIGEP